MINDIKKVTVKYNERVVGYLAEIEPSVIGFQYDEAQVKDGFSISPLSLPLNNAVHVSKKELFAGLFGVQAEFAQFFGGTSLLILVGVVLDTLQQVESHLLMRHYDGLLSSGRIQGRSANVAAY